MHHVTSAQTRLLTLIAALAASVGVGVWLIPTDLLAPEPAGDGSAPQPPAQRYRPYTPPVPGEWATLAESLRAVRPAPQPPAQRPVAQAETEEPEAEPETEQRPVVRINWRYQGYAERNGVRRALVRLGNRQEFFREGDVMTDETLRDDVVHTLQDIDPERIVIDQNGREIVLEIVEPRRSPVRNTRPARRGALGRNQS